MAEAPIFIRQEIVDRLKSGDFVPSRRKKPIPLEADIERRRSSPLNLIKRAIRYEPMVFHNRKPIVLQLVQALNAPEKKIILIGGEQGIGKSSLARALLEPMGGGKEQVLWFDANRYTDFDDVSHFLLRSIQELFSEELTSPGIRASERRIDGERSSEPAARSGMATSNFSAAGGRGDPMLAQLDKLLRQAAQVPLLLVLDNVEYLVDNHLSFSSTPFKEILNFLLGFPNIKMILLGERLPYTDMHPGHRSVEDVRLQGLAPDDALIWLEKAQRKAPDSTTGNDSALLEQALIGKAPAKRSGSPEETKGSNRQALKSLIQKTEGSPWLLKTVLRLNHQAVMPMETINALLPSPQPPARPASRQAASNTRESVHHNDRLLSSMIQLIEDRLPDQHRAILYILSFLRHPVNLPALEVIIGTCYPPLSPERLGKEALEGIMDHSLLRCLLKISYPPQEVLAHVRRVRTLHPAESERKFRPGYELYLAPKSLLYQRMPVEEKEALHTALRDLFFRERSREAQARSLRIKNRILMAEGRHHSTLLQELHRDEPLLKSSGSALSGPELDEEDSSDNLFRIEKQDPKHERSPGDVVSRGAYDGRAGFSGSFSGQNYRGFSDEADPGRAWEDFSGQWVGESLQESKSGWDVSYRSPFRVQIAENSASFQDILEQEASLSSSPKKATYRSPLSNFKNQPNLNEDISQQLWSELDDKVSERNLNDNPTLKLALAPKPAVNAEGQAEQEHPLSKELKLAIKARDSEGVANAVLHLGLQLSSRGQYKPAISLFQLIKPFRKVLPRDILAQLYHAEGSTCKQAYEHNAALKALNRAAALVRKLIYADETVSLQWMQKLGGIYHDLGAIYAYREQIKEAVDAYEEALRWYRSANEDGLAAEVYFQLAGLAEDNHRPKDAIAYYERAIAWDQAQGNFLSAAAGLSNLGNLHMAALRYDEAEICFQESLQQDRIGKNIEGQFNTLICLFKLYSQRQQWDQAQQSARHGLALAVRSNKRFWQATFHVKLGEVAEASETWAEAAEQYRLAKSTGASELSSESLDWLRQKIQETSHYK